MTEHHVKAKEILRIALTRVSGMKVTDSDAQAVMNSLADVGLWIQGPTVPDMFWNARDPEFSHESLSEFYEHGEVSPGEVWEAACAMSLPSVWVWCPPPAEDESGYPEPQTFGSREDAEKAAREWREKNGA